MARSVERGRSDEPSFCRIGEPRGPGSAAACRAVSVAHDAPGRSARLRTLADSCEQGDRIGRELDVDIYEALGFVVRRTPLQPRSRRTPAGGIYQQGAQWKAVGRISADLGVTVDMIERLLPDLDWTLGFDAGCARYRASLSGHEGTAPVAACALCAALLRVAAGRMQHRLSPAGPQRAAMADVHVDTLQPGGEA